VGQLVTRDDVRGWLELVLRSSVVTEEAFDSAAAALTAARDRAGTDATPIGDLLPEEDFERIARVGVGLERIRGAIIQEVTTSEVYSRLISHVLYQGLKDYLANQNMIAKKVPGASSVMRLGQSALGSAAPGLGKGIDRQLMGFVNSNISDTLRDSRDYLEAALDEDVLMTVAREAYRGAAHTRLDEAVGSVPEEAFDELVAAAVDAWIHIRGTDSFAEALEAAADDLHSRWADRTVGQVVDAAGLTREDLVAAALPTAVRAVASAYADGTLAAWIRARLEPFYTHFADGLEQPGAVRA
jgi:hypothetical protein